MAIGEIEIVAPVVEIEVLRKNGIRDLAFFRLQEYAPQCLEAVFGAARKTEP